MKKYCSDQFRVDRFLLKHEDVSDFYVSCWQSNRATLPLLCFRTVIFLGCLAILLTSMIMTGISVNFGFWFIYMTHWGILFITLTSGFALGVSYMAYKKGHIDHIFELPWYVKAYWVLYNTTVPIAFFITVFYWTFLTGSDIDYAIDPVLDVFIHAVNSVMMLALLVTARHPSHLLHFTFPVAFGLVYLIFSVIYYFAGGVDPFGNRYVYPNLDWAKAGETSIMAVVSAVGIIVLHAVVVGLSVLRDYATSRIRRDSKSFHI